MHHLRFGVETDLISRFLKLIGPGFKLKIKAGLSIRELLCVHLGISDDYFENRIQTIFLDGMPVDNVDTAWVDDDTRIALSAAMPGLVGATFRKGGPYASFRSTISYSKAKKPLVKGDVKINVKLFNMIAKELGPVFLQKGIIIEGITFQKFLIHNLEDIKGACISIQLNSAKSELAKLIEMDWENMEVFLQVSSEKSS
jgi:hypothetical protein